MDDPKTITAILRSKDETPEVVNRAVTVLYGDLRKIASRLLRGERKGHTLLTADLVNEAYLRLFGLERIEFTDRLHFFNVAAGTMRRILVDHERRRRAQKRLPPGSMRPMHEADEAPLFQPSVDVLGLHDALKRLSRVDPRRAQMVELRYFGGLGEDEVAELLELSRRTVSREVRIAKLWLRHEMGGSAQREP